LALPGLPRPKVLAAVVRLLDTGMMRVGNEEYARRNKSFGLASLRSRHVDVTGPRIKFEFRGKSGVQHAFDLNDRRLARIIKQCQELPGHELFQYIDEHGERSTIDSADVNEYLRAIAGDDFSSKDFRTWAGTVLAASALVESDRAARKTSKKSVTRAIQAVANQLGNTAAVCRKCYIHPLVFESQADGSLFDRFARHNGKNANSLRGKLTRKEAALLALLNKRAKRNGAGQDLRRQLRKSLARAKAA
jgi:DNA topoisomerase-1